jgi:AbrB family looped-hinge helix DNA binding protein
MKTVYTLQENGQVTLPAEWREKNHLKKGDVLSFIETDEGLLIMPKRVLAAKLLDEIGDALREKGITLEELLESGREIRSELARETYGDKTAT